MLSFGFIAERGSHHSLFLGMAGGSERTGFGIYTCFDSQALISVVFIAELSVLLFLSLCDCMAIFSIRRMCESSSDVIVSLH